MEPAVNFVPLRGPFELERALLQFPWLANLARDKTVTVYLAWNLTPVPRIVGVAAWRRTDSEFAKV
ncbi:MAG: hypothetical protein LR015_00910 [Verrucomicrobia bacterium]|nr:hypothetical protein [Verrucomicrobiota bacterium]